MQPRRSASAPVASRAIAGAFSASVIAHALTAGAVALTSAPIAPPVELEPPVAVELASAELAFAEGAAAPAPATASPRPAASRRSSRHALLAPPASSARAQGPLADAVVPTKPTNDAARPSAPSPVRFALSAGVVASRRAPADEGGSAAALGEDTASESTVDVPARLLSRQPIAYPPEARHAEVEADVPLELVVDADGRVQDAKILVRRGYGLDDAALTAVRGHRFAPAMRGGRAVSVRMRWTIQFRLD